jgi:hypothetical protein
MVHHLAQEHGAERHDPQTLRTAPIAGVETTTVRALERRRPRRARDAAFVTRRTAATSPLESKVAPCVR